MNLPRWRTNVRTGTLVNMPKITRRAAVKSKSKPKKTKPAAKSGKAKAVKPPPKVTAAKKPKPWTEAEVREAFERFRKANPEPKGELEHLNPFTLLVAVVLSAQATDAGVNRATRALFPIADTPQKMLDLAKRSC